MKPKKDSMPSRQVCATITRGGSPESLGGESTSTECEDFNVNPPEISVKKRQRDRKNNRESDLEDVEQKLSYSHLGARVKKVPNKLRWLAKSRRKLRGKGDTEKLNKGYTTQLHPKTHHAWVFQDPH